MSVSVAAAVEVAEVSPGDGGESTTLTWCSTPGAATDSGNSRRNSSTGAEAGAHHGCKLVVC